MNDILTSGSKDLSYYSDPIFEPRQVFPGQTSPVKLHQFRGRRIDPVATLSSDSRPHCPKLGSSISNQPYTASFQYVSAEDLVLNPDTPTTNPPGAYPAGLASPIIQATRRQQKRTASSHGKCSVTERESARSTTKATWCSHLTSAKSLPSPSLSASCTAILPTAAVTSNSRSKSQSQRIGFCAGTAWRLLLAAR